MSSYSNMLILFSIMLLINISLCKQRNYDNFDIENMLSNPMRSKRFFECIRNESSCTTEDKEMKHDLVEMITTSCAGCTAIEKSKLQSLKRRAMDDPQILNLALGDM